MHLIERVIGIHGVPRSGTSWVAQILNSHPDIKLKFQPLFSYALKDLIDEKATLDEINSFYAKMWNNEDDLFLNLKDPIIHKNYPVFNKSSNPNILAFKQVHHHYILPNLLYRDKEIKMIFLVRNPLAILLSWKNAPKEFNPKWNFMEQWRCAQLKNADSRENYFGFEKWKQASKLFIQLRDQYRDRVYLLNYTDLLADLKFETQRLFEFLGFKELPNQTNGFLNDSKAINHSDPNSVFKSKTDDNNWESEMPSIVIEEVLRDDIFTLLNKEFQWVRNGF